MAEDLYINAGSKTEKYRALLPQLKNLLAGEDDLIANLASFGGAERDFPFLLGRLLFGEG